MARVSTVVMSPGVASLDTYSPRTPRLNEKCSFSDQLSLMKNDDVSMSTRAPRDGIQFSISDSKVENTGISLLSTRTGSPFSSTL